MTARNDQPIGLIDISAIEYAARAARAEDMRVFAVALPGMIGRVVAQLRLKRGQQTEVFA